MSEALPPRGRCAAILLAALVALVVQAPARAALLSDRVRQACEERVAAGMYHVVVIGLVEDGKVEISAFGTLPDGRPADGDTVFEIGSITKTFTATLLAEAVQAGRLTVDGPIGELLPGTKIPSRNGKHITLLDIATHRSGLPRVPYNLAPSDRRNPYADYDATRLRAFLASYGLLRDPGESYEYSNLAVGLLGYALAERARTTYGALVARKIFQPLEMKMTSIGPSREASARIAPPFDQLGAPAENWEFGVLAGAGGIRSTANDMVRYLKANMGMGPIKLTSAMELAQQPRRPIDKRTQIGLVWMTRTTTKGDIVWHTGLTGGYSSFIGFTADRRRGVVVLTDDGFPIDDLASAALQPDAPLTPAHKTLAVPAAVLEDYEGTYRLSDTRLLYVERVSGQLYARATGQAVFPIFPWAADEFFAKISGISISFKRDGDGGINGMTFHQNGDRIAPKLTDDQIAARNGALQLDPGTLAEYAGEFQLTPDTIVTITSSGKQLSGKLNGQAAFAMFAHGRDQFSIETFNAGIDFERDQTGKVVALILHQDSNEQRAPRIER